jgi:hypothetical protein
VAGSWVTGSVPVAQVLHELSLAELYTGALPSATATLSLDAACLSYQTMLVLNALGERKSVPGCDRHSVAK